MKTYLNWIAAVAVAGLTVAATPVIAQTSVKQDANVTFTDGQVSETTNPGTLVLGAGGTRRVVARIGMDDPNLLRLQLSNLSEYHTTITLAAADGAVRWEQDVEGKPAFAKMIDLKALTVDPGIYTLRVNAGEAFLEQEIVVKNRKTTLGSLRYGAVATPATMAKHGSY